MKAWDPCTTCWDAREVYGPGAVASPCPSCRPERARAELTTQDPAEVDARTRKPLHQQLARALFRHLPQLAFLAAAVVATGWLEGRPL